MNNKFPKDILFIIFITIISVICVFMLPLANYPLNIMSYIVLGLFLPGYALMAAIYPIKEDMGWFKRIFGSVTISILLTILLVMISDYNILGINISNGFIIIGILTILLSIDALEGHMRNFNRYKNNIKPENQAQNKKFASLDLLFVFLATVIFTSFVGIIKFNETIFTYIAILILLFLPGYSVMAALYPKKDDLNGLQRTSISFGFPMVGLSLGILIQNINPIAVSLPFILLLIATFTIVFIIIAYIRRRKVSVNENRYVNLKTSNLNKKSQYKTKSKLNENEPKVMSKESTNQIIYKPKFAYKDLLLIFFITSITIIFVLTPKLNDTVVRTILGLFLILFIPGYSLIASLFPKKDDLEGIERATLSFGLSVAITPLIGLALNYTPYGIKLIPILISLSAFSVIMIFIAFIRRSRVQDDQKFYVNFGGFYNSIKGQFKGESKTSKILSIILIISIVLAISTTAYIIIKPKQGETFTEFYLLGPGGTASNYPTNLTVGQNASIIIGIVNHEQQTVDYNLVITSNGNVMSDQNITLANGNKTEIPYTFSSNTVGTKEIEFILYKLPDNTTIYRSLHLFVNVR